jgi:hypothetical protein
VTEFHRFASVAERAVQLLDIVHALSDVPDGVVACSPRINNISGPKSKSLSPYNVCVSFLLQEKYVNPNNIIIKDVVIFFIS